MPICAARSWPLTLRSAITGQFDPLTTDPAGLSVFLDLPEGLGIREGSVRLGMSVSHPERGRESGDWVLNPARDRQGRQVFRLSAKEAAEFRAVQAVAREWKAADAEGTAGSLSVSLGGCRTVPLSELEGARASVFVRMSPDGPERAVFRDAPISNVFTRGTVEALPPCR